jgi:hypothetical protein
MANTSCWWLHDGFSDGPSKFAPPFKRLNQKELIECLEHGWTGRVTFVKAAEPPASGKYAQMLYDTRLRKSAYASVIVFPAEGRWYRQVDFKVVDALEKKGLVVLTYVSDCEAVFQLKKEA